MTKRVERFRVGHVGEVFVRMRATGDGVLRAGWGGVPGRHEVEVETLPPGDRRGFRAMVPMENVVAMVVDADGGSATPMVFYTPDEAAQALADRGWSVANPDGVARTTDAHADPFGEARYVAVPIDGNAGWWVLDRDRMALVGGRYSQQADALERAADLNDKDSAR